ncbi:hypothetical protein IW137_004288, partial [Coemansia sp. RSA 1287]
MDDEIKAQLDAERQKRKQITTSDIKYDTELYESGDKFSNYDQSIDTDTTEEIHQPKSGRFGITAPRELIEELQNTDATDDPF